MNERMRLSYKYTQTDNLLIYTKLILIDHKAYSYLNKY